MKYLYLIVLLVVLLFSCVEPDIYNEYYNNGSFKEFVNKVVFPEPLVKSYSPNTAVQDWTNGIIYKENSKQDDGLIHTLDLGYLTGGKQALVYLEVKVIDHGMNNITDLPDDTAGQIYIREKNNLASWNSVSPRFNQYSQGILVLTNDIGQIEWYHEHTANFWDNPTCDPGFEIYKWEKITITAKWLVNGMTVK